MGSPVMQGHHLGSHCASLGAQESSRAPGEAEQTDLEEALAITLTASSKHG